VFRRILGGIAYVQKGLKDLEDVESSALGLRSGEGRVLEDWEDVVFSALGLHPGVGIPVDVAGYRSVFLLGPLMDCPGALSYWSARVLVPAHDVVGPQRDVIGVRYVRV